MILTVQLMPHSHSFLLLLKNMPVYQRSHQSPAVNKVDKDGTALVDLQYK